MKENQNKSLAIFETFKIRRHYDEERETWYFSVIDIVAALTEQHDFQTARKYWNKLSERLKSEGSEVVTNCHRLKMTAQDGKMRETDVADVETILRIVQSVPSKKAEPIKLWLAKVGYQRIEEMNDPAIALNRSREYWQKQGRSKKWIQQRMLGQETRNKLTDYWDKHGVKKDDEFAILTNIIHKEWSDLTVKEHKSLKGLKTPESAGSHE
ncbi:MAG: BRO family protein [Ignavibacteriaceae bacterium]|nr:BRO family protein [Ignavibacteriaceae bacterium]